MLHNTSLKTGIGLIVVGIVTGIIAGILVVTVDFSSAEIYLWIALIGATAFSTIMTVIAYKKGKFPQS